MTQTVFSLTQQDHRNLGIRRDPLTGEYISVSGTVPLLDSYSRRLQANGTLLEAEAAAFAGADYQDDAADPLSALEAGVLKPQEATHLETISTFGQLSDSLVIALLGEYIDRFTELVPRRDISELSVKEMCVEGEVTAQIAGFTTPSDATETVDEQAQRWARRTGGDLLADVLVSELVASERILFTGDHWVAYVPYASAHPCEIMLLPKAPSRNLVAMTDSAQEDLQRTYRRALAALRRLSGVAASYTSTWHMVPIPHCRAVSRMRVHITAETDLLRGKTPEQVAQTLREYL